MTSHVVSVLLPEGWGWLSGDPTLLRDTLAAVLPADLDAHTYEQFVLRSIDEVLTLRAALAPWQIAGLAAWTQEAVIGGEDQVLSASLMLAILPTPVPIDVDSLSHGVERSTLSGTLSAVERVDVGDRRAVQVDGLSQGAVERPATRFSIFLVPVPEIASLAMLHFTTPDDPDWAAFGPLFAAIAGTLSIDLIPDPEPGESTATPSAPAPPGSGRG
jgi:hypothetical protein